MAKTIEKWLLFTYVDGEFTPLSQPFKTKQLAEKARTKYPEQERRKIGVGVRLNPGAEEGKQARSTCLPRKPD